MKAKNIPLVLAGALSFCAALFQLVIVIVPEWSVFFGAPEDLVSNPTMLLAAGIVVSAVLAIFGFYALSGAGVIRRLPLLRLGLFLIGAIYLLRGLQFIIEILVLLNVLPSPVPVPLQNPLVSLGSLLAGLAYWIGLATGWKTMSPRAVPAAI